MCFKKILPLFLCITVFTFSQTALKGRIAVSSDGNQHDEDDICATPMSIAIFAVAGLKDKLVYYGHSDHIWDNNANQENRMIESAEGTIQRYAYNTTTTKVFNAFRQTNQAISALSAAIEASTEDDPLWLIGAGPMEVIGRAIKNATKGKQYVTVISHSDWNNKHADTEHNGYNFSDFSGMGVKTKQIKDQNGGLNKPYSEFYWLRDSNDSKQKWLWDRGQAAGKNNFDCSDCGMAYWLITGGINGGDENGNPQKLKTFFTATALKNISCNSKTMPLQIITKRDGTVKISLNDFNEKGSLMIFNLKNQLVHTAAIPGGHCSLDISECKSPGFYIIKINLQNQSLQQKIVVR